MDMKKILQAFDGAATKKSVAGASDMKKFLSIVNESSNPYKPVEERVITGFEEGSVGGDANSFLLSADRINDLVMSEIDKVKINADGQLLKDLMSKFNAFMSAYHAVGKEILQPDLFDDTMGESTLKDKEDLQAKRKALQDIQMDPATADDQELSKAVMQRKADLEKEAKAKGFAESIEEATYGNRDAYQRDYDSSVSGFDRGGRDWDEGDKEPPNNFAVYINGKKWKVFKGRGYHADDFKERQHYKQLQDWAAKKSASSGKKWTVHVTGEQPTAESLSFTDYFNLAESKKGLE